MNKAESGVIENTLLEKGWKPAGDISQAGVVLINTCSVRTTAENRVIGILGGYKNLKAKHKFKLLVMGCMVERLKEQFREKIPFVDSFIGTFQKKEILSFIEEEEKSKKQDFFEEDTYQFFEYHTPVVFSGEEEEVSKDTSQAFVPIMHGCNNFCSYCIVPYVRGREVSRDPGHIIHEIQKLEEKGIKEVTLLGQNVNSYRFGDTDGGELAFPGLLQKILDETGIPWLRFMTSHPKDFSDELIEVMKDNPRICRHIHLPFQHGSDTILKAMNRKYTRDHYLGLMDKVKKAIPNVTLSTDILIGFPGETEQDFQDTLDVMQKAEFDDAFTYKYNPIEGTKAFKMGDQIDDSVKTKRLEEIIALQRKISSRRKASRVGSNQVVLVEKVSKKADNEVLGRTEGNEMVVFEGGPEKIGTFCTVKLIELRGNTFKGDEI